MSKALKHLVILIIALVTNSVTNAQDVDPLAEAFGILPEIRNVLISPDGKKILMLQEIDDTTVIVTRDLTNSEAAPIGIPIEEGHIRSAVWANNDSIIAYVVGSRYLHLAEAGYWRAGELMLARIEEKVLIDWQGKNAKKLKLRKQISDMLYDDEEHILVRDGERFFKYNLSTHDEERTLMAPLYAYGDAYMDKDKNIRFIDGTGNSTWANHLIRKGFYRKSAGSEWREIAEIDIRVAKSDVYEKLFRDLVVFAGFTDDPEIVNVLAYDEDGKASLFTYNAITDQKLEKILSHEEHGIAHVEFDENYLLEAYYINGEKRTMIGVSDEFMKLERIFEKSFPNSIVDIVNRSTDENVLTLRVEAPNDPGSYYVLDLNTNKIVMIGYIYQGVDVEQLSEMVAVSYESADGLMIPGYLTLPKGKEPKNLPTIIFPLENINSRTSWGFDYRVQYYASLGYAVLQIDYRGSIGYDLNHVKTGMFELSGKVITDVNNGTKWLIDQGIADPDRICLVGSKYSGYASLQAIILEEKLYKCAVVTDPIFNFKRFFNEIIDNYLDEKGIDEEEVSPYHRYKDIQTPLLVIQEEALHTREKYEYERFTDNIKREGTPAELYYVEDLNVNNRARKLQVSADFIEMQMQ